MTLIRNQASRDNTLSACPVRTHVLSPPLIQPPPLISVEDELQEELLRYFYRGYLCVRCQGYVGPLDEDSGVHEDERTSDN